jgi:HEAT repeat protein
MRKFAHLDYDQSMENLYDPDLEVRLRAIGDLGYIGDDDTVTALLQLLDDPDLATQLYKYSIYTQIIFTLESLLSKKLHPSAESRIIQIFLDETEPNEGYRALCAEALGNINTDACFQALLDYAERATPRIQETIAFAFGQTRRKEALSTLYKMIEAQSENNAIVYEAQESIRRINQKPKANRQ